ncbi:MAG: prepilin-type N-terminal cleavage/methylation domain-containing protein [Planctomycetota bacterium]
MNRARRQAGFSLIEVTASIAILSLVMVSLTQLGSTTTNAYDTSSGRTERELEAQRALEQVVGILTAAGSTTFNPPIDGVALGTTDLRYNVITSMVGGVPNWSNTHRLVLQLEPGELDNGVDDDGDGLADERQLVSILDEGELNQRARILVKGVSELGLGELANGVDDDGDGVIDEAGFSMHQTGDLLFIELALDGRTSDTDQFTVEAETRTAVRN